MHEYAVFGHDRATVGRWLGVASITVAGVAAQLVTWASTLTGLESFAQATVTSGLAYFVLHLVFNKWGWKLLTLPDLTGTWDIEGKAIDGDGNITYEWKAVAGIEQSWKNMLIHLKTKSSQSDSYTAILMRNNSPTSGWQLSYSYLNEPEVQSSHELGIHKGYCEVDFDDQLKSGSAAYFNSKGRRTVGVMTWKKRGI